ncbi:MAG TPA: NADH-quinone oxidoreductase subunit M [Ktedonobacteraceae bacterium]|jgi:NADH-quinone oxidoreductase subunit M
MFPILSTIVFLPLLGGIAVLLVPARLQNLARWLALGAALLDVLFVFALVLAYSQANLAASSSIIGATFSSTFLASVSEQVPLVASGSFTLSYSLGVDGISLLLVALTSLLGAVCIAASLHIGQRVRQYLAFLLLLECGMLGVFLATNLFLLYMFWELMLIPAYLLVGSWGGERRIAAAFKFVLYTSVGSLLMLAGIIALGYYHQRASGGPYTLDIFALMGTKLDATTQSWLFLALAAAFAVKVPLIPLHSWLPDAYSEAPAPVTAMLAGAMSKTGAYGFLRFCIPLFPQAFRQFSTLLSVLAVIGILYCALLALAQTDIKRLLGYASISHLGLVLLGMFALNVQGVEGSVLQMLNHGITTAALFLIVGFLEARAGTRNIAEFSGMALRVPLLATVLLIACLSSLGLPGLNSFSGEFLALLGIFQQSVMLGVLATAVVVPAAWYLIRLFQQVMQGPPLGEGHVFALLRKGQFADIRLGEFVALLPLLIFIFLIGFQVNPLTALMEPSVVNTLQHALQTVGSALIR